MRKAGTEVQNNFVRGLVTEATGLNFPENAVTETLNCYFDKTGLTRRRLGFDLEASASISTISSADNGSSIRVYKWKTTTDGGNIVFAVVQVGDTVYFYEISDTISSGKKTFTISLSDYLVSGSSYTVSDIRQSRAGFSSGNDYLFIAHKYCEPLYVEYDPSSDDITVTEVTVKIRDQKGIDDGYEVDEYPPQSSPIVPGDLTLEHEYNLQNQGWVNKYSALIFPAGVVVANPISFWESWFGQLNYPSNSEQWWLYKDSAGDLNNANALSIVVGNSPAPRGHYIYNAFNIVRAVKYDTGVTRPTGSLSSGLSTVVETETSNYIRPSITEFYASRVWWSGVNTGEYSSKIYFSQIIEGPESFGKCYQRNDPTCEELTDLLPTDGGVIVIPEVVEILHLQSFSNFLIVFASNGIWLIRGSEVQGFTADNYEVSKISDIGIQSPHSVVVAENTPVWWTYSGIYSVAPKGTSIEVISVSNKSIKTFFNAIPNSSKDYAQGSYNLLNKEIYWLYRSTEAASFSENFEYDRMLLFNVETGVFMVYSISESDYKVQSVIDVSTELGDEFSMKMLVIGKDTVADDITWADERDGRYVDWYSVDSTGVDYESYFHAGYRIKAEGNKDFQSGYVTFVSKAEENSSFYVYGRWDYSNSSDSNRFTTRQQGYVHKNGHEFLNRKLRFRGHGKSCQFSVVSESGKPFNIIGWIVFDTAEELT